MSRQALTPTNIPALASAPTTPTLRTGDMYFNTGDGKTYTYNGTAWTAPAGSGTVTSITAGTGLTGGTITSSGTIAVNSAVVTLTTDYTSALLLGGM